MYTFNFMSMLLQNINFLIPNIISLVYAPNTCIGIFLITQIKLYIHCNVLINPS